MRRRGFSLIEVMLSIVILTTGLVSLLGVFGLAMASTQTTQQDMIAKQLANEAYESIVTARNTSQIDWDEIQNNAGTQYCTDLPSPCGIFIGSAGVAQFQPIYNAGADGIFGTADDANAGEETLREPGPDGTYGDVDDIQLPLTTLSARDPDCAGVRRERQLRAFGAKRDDHHAIPDSAVESDEDLRSEFVHFGVPVKRSYERSIDKTRARIQPDGNDGGHGAGHAGAGLCAAAL